MKKFRVFIGPSRAELTVQDHHHKDSFVWKNAIAAPYNSQSRSLVLPPATLEAVSRRLSLIYKNVIFDECSQEHETEERRDNFVEDEIDPTESITWEPTQADESEDRNRPDVISFEDTRSGALQFRQTPQTQETASYEYSDASSIARFPHFHFSLHALTSLSALSVTFKEIKASRKVTVLLAVFEVEGPDTVKIRKGFDAGKEVSIMKLIVGDDDGFVSKLIVWRETAERWSGADVSPAVKRGDIALFENITANWEPDAPTTLTASPFMKSKLEICYRTMPCSLEDGRLRPDLRLCNSDAAVKRVAVLVSWFQKAAGLSII